MLKPDRKIKKTEFINYMKEYLANVAIGASTLRNQGAPKVAKKAREFLMNRDLSVLRKIKPSQYPKLLERWTKQLMTSFPKGAKKNWGAARKALNLFFNQVFMNKYLGKEYGVAKFGDVFETPLDSQARKFLQEKAGKGKLCAWHTIKGLKPEQSACYQEFASVFAKKKGIPRVCLDIMIWRKRKK